MNLESVEQIVRLMGEYPVSEISVEQDGRRICVRKPAGAVTFASPEAGDAAINANDEMLAVEASAVLTEALAAAEAAAEEARTLTATMVGIFHHAEPPIPYAAILTPGQVIGSIESMKLMNEVLADAGGRVTEVLIEDGAPVEYGQALFRLAA